MIKVIGKLKGIDKKFTVTWENGVIRSNSFMINLLKTEIKLRKKYGITAGYPGVTNSDQYIEDPVVFCALMEEIFESCDFEGKMPKKEYDPKLIY